LDLEFLSADDIRRNSADGRQARPWPELDILVQAELSHRRLGSSGSTTNATTSDGSHHGRSHPEYTLFFMFNAIIIGTVILHIAALPRFHGLQQFVCLFVLGILFSFFQEGLALKDQLGVFGKSYSMWMAIDPRLLLFVMLPGLLAGGSMSMNTTIARGIAQQCCFLAGPGGLIASFLMAGFLYVLVPEWSFLLCLTCAAILADTDPVAVVGLLKDLGASPTLMVQIQGEAVLSHGVAIVLYSVVYDMLSGKSYDASDIVIVLVLVDICAMGLGLFIGWFFFMWIKLASDRLNYQAGMIQTSLTLSCAYWSFCIAEGALHISGVLCTVTASLLLADKMWPLIVDKTGLLHIWSLFEFLCNTLVFFLAGALTGNTMIHIPAIDYARLVAIYAACMVIRGLFLFSARPVLTHLSVDREEVAVTDVLVMTWAGLRGAVGLALGIQVSIDQAGGQISEMDGRRVLFYVGGVATMTLVINATTCPALIRKLGLTKTPEGKQMILERIYKQLQPMLMNERPVELVQASVMAVLHEVRHQVDLYGKHSHKSPDHEEVFAGVPNARRMRGCREAAEIDDNLEMARQAFEEKVSTNQLALLECPTFPFGQQEDDLRTLVDENACEAGLMKAVNCAFMALVQNEYWQQLDREEFPIATADLEMLMSTASLSMKFAHSHINDVKYLLMAIRDNHEDNGMDSELLNDMIRQEEGLEGRKKRRTAFRAGSIRGMRNSVSNMLQRTSLNSLQSRSSTNDIGALVQENTLVDMLGIWRGKKGGPETSLMGKIDSVKFHVCISVVLILNSIFILIEQTKRNAANYHSNWWLICELTFAAIFTLEFFVKLIAYRCGFFMDGWNWFDFILLALTYFGLIMELMAKEEGGGGNDVSNEARIFRLNRLFRVLRILRLFRMIKFVKLLAHKLNSGDISLELGEHMRTIVILRSFVRAHTESQKKLARLFGDRGSITSCEEARVILESQTAVYKALLVASAEAEEVDMASMVCVQMLQQNTKITRKMCDFVVCARESGVITGRECKCVALPLVMGVRSFHVETRQTVRGCTRSSRKYQNYSSYDLTDHKGRRRDSLADWNLKPMRSLPMSETLVLSETNSSWNSDEEGEDRPGTGYSKDRRSVPDPFLPSALMEEDEPEVSAEALPEAGMAMLRPGQKAELSLNSSVQAQAQAQSQEDINSLSDGSGPDKVASSIPDDSRPLFIDQLDQRSPSDASKDFSLSRSPCMNSYSYLTNTSYGQHAASLLAARRQQTIGEKLRSAAKANPSNPSEDSIQEIP
jgi:sodium/hydrogen exchanger 10/11